MFIYRTFDVTCTTPVRRGTVVMIIDRTNETRQYCRLMFQEKNKVPYYLSTDSVNSIQ